MVYNCISSVNFKHVGHEDRNLYRNVRKRYGSLRTCPPFEVGKCFRNLGKNRTCHRFHSQDIHIPISNGLAQFSDLLRGTAQKLALDQKQNSRRCPPCKVQPSQQAQLGDRNTRNGEMLGSCCHAGSCWVYGV